MARNKKYREIGSEWVRKDGMVLIKVSPSKWIYKQRKVWIDHYGEIPKNHFIIFLDGNRSNYDISNLACVTSREASLIANLKMTYDNKELTKAGIQIAKLLVAGKEKLNIKPSSHKRKR